MDADRLGRLLGAAVAEVRPVTGGDICAAYQVRLRDGRTVFAKTASVSPDFFAAEARGLDWLAAGGAPVPAVLGYDAEALILSWLPPGSPTPAGAARAGADLAALHLSGAPTFGAGWPGYIGSLPMDNGAEPSWPEFYALRRIEPYVRRLRDRGALADTGPFDRLAARLPELAGPPEPPARLHGDLWSGNLLWSASGRAYLVDPAAHGGHRETDLAMLDLFGAPLLDRILDSYANAAAERGSPLAPGWPDRVPLHQLFPLLVHAVLFGGGYRDRAVAVARRYAG